MSGKLFIISAPSGAGKSTLVKHVLQRMQQSYEIERVVTYTTKKPRKGESVDGQDFNFISQSEFEHKITQGYFIEWSNAYGNYYGSPRSILQRMTMGQSLILILDRTGAQQIKQKVPKAIMIWIYTSSIDVLRGRLGARGGETREQIEYRLRLAQQEIEEEDQSPRYQFHILNDDFYDSLEQLSIIFEENLKGTL